MIDGFPMELPNLCHVHLIRASWPLIASYTAKAKAPNLTISADFISNRSFSIKFGGMGLIQQYQGRIRQQMLRKFAGAIDLRFDPGYAVLGRPVPAQKTGLWASALVPVPFI